jgi:hypothetical protein
LFAFYHDKVKPLYSAVQLQNELPVEVLFEINAAWDHISRQYAYGESEESVVRHAYAHLKRSCLDIFKLAVKDAVGQFKELRRIDTSIINNGQYDRELIALYNRVRTGAITARLQEGNIKEDGEAIKAFDLWEPVYDDCVTLMKDFYFSDHVTWARKKQKRGIWWERVISFGLGVAASVIASVIYSYATA